APARGRQDERARGKLREIEILPGESAMEGLFGPERKARQLAAFDPHPAVEYRSHSVARAASEGQFQLAHSDASSIRSLSSTILSALIFRASGRSSSHQTLRFGTPLPQAAI